MRGNLAEISRFEIDEVDLASCRPGHGSRAVDRGLRRVLVADDHGGRERAVCRVGVAAADRERAATDDDRAGGGWAAIAPVDGGAVVVADGAAGVGRV